MDGSTSKQADLNKCLYICIHIQYTYSFSATLHGLLGLGLCHQETNPIYHRLRLLSVLTEMIRCPQTKCQQGAACCSGMCGKTKKLRVSSHQVKFCATPTLISLMSQSCLQLFTSLSLSPSPHSRSVSLEAKSS